MTRWMNQMAKVWKEDQVYLQMVIVVFFLIPIAYFGYLSMSASMLQRDVMSLLTDSAVEGVHLIVNISMFYGAYVIKLYMHHQEERSSCIGFGIILLAQLLFLNPFTCFLLIFYVSRFLGFRQIKVYYIHAKKGWNWKILLPALLVLCLSIVTLILKIKLQIVF